MFHSAQSLAEVDWDPVFHASSYTPYFCSFHCSFFLDIKNSFFYHFFSVSKTFFIIHFRRVFQTKYVPFPCIHHPSLSTLLDLPWRGKSCGKASLSAQHGESLSYIFSSWQVWFISLKCVGWQKIENCGTLNHLFYIWEN